jgi:hypothetical protein
LPATVINPHDGDDLSAASITVNVTDKIVAWEGSHETGATTNGAVRHASDQIDDAALPELATPSSGAQTTGAGVHARLDMFAVVISGIMGTAGSGYAAKYANLGPLTYGSIAAVNTALTTGASSAAGASTLVRRASDGSANFSGTVGVVALSGTGNWATTGSLTAVGVTNSGVYVAGSGARQITTTDGHLDATQLSGAVPAGSMPALTGDVTTAVGTVATTVSSVGGKTAAQVGTVVTSILAASSTGVGNHGANAKFDASGGMTFDAVVTAPSFAGALTGNASSATTAGSASALSAINPVPMGGTGVGTIPVGSVVIGAGTSPFTSIAPGSLNNVLISNGTLWGSGPVVLNDYSVATTKIADGAILPEGGTQRVWVNAIKKWSSVGVALHWDGGFADLSTYIAALGTSQRAYVLIELNDTAALHLNPGSPVTGALADVNIPVKDPNTTALGLVVIYFGQTVIASTDIVPWRGPGESSSSSSGGGNEVIGHNHAIAPEIRITSGGIDEGFPTPTVTPSMSIRIFPLHYRSTAGVASSISVATTQGGFAAPASGFRMYGVYFDPSIPGFANTAPSDDPSAPAKPTFSGNQRSICYVHLRSASTIIKASDDGTNGWIEDARTFLAGASPSTLPIGVSDGGTGNSTYASSGLLMAGVGSTTAPFTEVAATTSVTQGLNIAPTTTPATSDSAQTVLGGGTIATGASSLTNAIGLDVITATKTGTGVLTRHSPLRSTAGAIGTDNYAGIFLGGVAITGVTAFPAAPQTNETCYRRDLGAWFRWDATAWRQMGDAYFTNATRPAAPPNGFRYRDLTDNFTYRYTGSTYVKQSTAVRLADYILASDTWSATALSAGGFIAVGSTINFTVEDAGSQVALHFAIAMVYQNTSATQGHTALRLNVDGVLGTVIADNFLAASNYAALNGGTVVLSGLSAGSHSVYVELRTAVNINLFMLAASAPANYGFRGTVIEHKP